MWRSGEKHHNAKLTDAQVREMRSIYENWKLHGARKGYSTLAFIFGVAASTARDIVTYRTRIGA